MYTTCMFCNRPLGSNEVVESFPVGRRLAFDPEKGRLWVVCRKCERWNLTPIEERWEAVEECESLFRSTRVRTSTENIGLARVSEGLELVRIGKALRPEFAAWRYGDQFGRRRRRALLYGAGGVVVFGSLVGGAVATGIVSGAALAQSGNFFNAWQSLRTRMRLRLDDGTVIRLRTPDLARARLLPLGEGGADFGIVVGRGRREHEFRGDEGRRVAAKIMARINRAGAGRRAIGQAVREIEAKGNPEAVIRDAALHMRRTLRRARLGQVGRLPVSTRLALEMALHEEQERRALEGELRALERAWREAEEIAAIADGLLLPEGTEAFLEGHRKES